MNLNLSSIMYGLLLNGFLHAICVCLIFLNSPPTAECYPQAENVPKSEKPNIVIILIDDMGFNDVSFHGSNQIVTPNIDALAYNGIILNKNYVPNMCTPSRASLLTGKYPIHTGTQHHVIANDEPWGLPLEEQTMAEIFQYAGYATNLVGKWHLGFYRQEMTPIYRGFDHHFGYYSGFIGYYDHKLKMLDRNYSGLDMRRDLTPCPEVSGIYATDLFTNEAVTIIKNHDEKDKKPLFLLLSHLGVHTGNDDNPMEAPEEEIEKFKYISDPKRRTYAAMISRVDQSVGQTIKALSEKSMLDNTIILLYSDNGAPTMGQYSNSGSNYPFRGQKESPWEGGIRSAGLIWSPLLNKRSYVSNQVTHAIDWLPTLAAAAGVPLPENLRLDGVNLWSALSEAEQPQPRRLIHVFDNVNGYSSYMRGHFKYVNGSTWEGKYDSWLGSIDQTETDTMGLSYEDSILDSTVSKELGTKDLTKDLIKTLREQATNECQFNRESLKEEIHKCEPLKAPCFFNLDEDPCEIYNLANLYPLEVSLLSQEVEDYRNGAMPPAKVAISDPLANPIRFNGNWQWWYGTQNSKGVSISSCFCILLLLINILLAFFMAV